MSDAERPIGAPEVPPPPPCAWCGQPSVTEVIVVAGKKKRKTSPVCADHAKRFEAQGQMTVRLEQSLAIERSERSNEWRKAHIRY
jgi:hypothetical protein